MKKRNCKIICIVCPLGCEIHLRIKEGRIEKIEGMKCTRGIKYAEQEFYNPQRVLTTTVRIKSDRLLLLPVRTDKPIPKGMLRECVRYLAEIEVEPPIKIGQIIVTNILNTRANIISTREVNSNCVYRKTQRKTSYCSN